MFCLSVCLSARLNDSKWSDVASIVKSVDLSGSVLFSEAQGAWSLIGCGELLGTVVSLAASPQN